MFDVLDTIVCIIVADVKSMLGINGDIQSNCVSGNRNIKGGLDMKLYIWISFTFCCLDDKVILVYGFSPVLHNLYFLSSVKIF